MKTEITHFQHKLKKMLLCLVACCMSLNIHAQSIADIQSPKILPPSPDAAALGKYGQIPVDKSTGIPDISVPIYEIKTPRFTLPISLSYHASGIKVDETASWVGLYLFPFMKLRHRALRCLFPCPIMHRA